MSHFYADIMELRLGCESLKDFHVEQGRYTNKMIKDIAFTDVRLLGTSVIALFVERGHVTGHETATNLLSIIVIYSLILS